MKYKVVLFDVDGVLIVPPKPFSDQYCKKYGIDSMELVKFFGTDEFKQASLGKFDLKDALNIHNNLWKWKGTPEELMNMWFEGENYPNKKLLEVVVKLRQDGTKVYLATQQEKYRKQWLELVAFKDKVDGLFCSCDLGYNKHEDHYWREVIKQLQDKYPGLKPNEIAYFDDKQSLVDMARVFGIDSHLYTESVKVEPILGA